jgi:hypothetical protein
MAGMLVRIRSFALGLNLQVGSCDKHAFQITSNSECFHFIFMADGWDSFPI